MAKLARINLASGRMSFRIEPSWQSPGRTAQFYDLADSGRLVAPLTALWNSVGFVSLLTSASPPTGCARMCTFSESRRDAEKRCRDRGGLWARAIVLPR